MGTNKQYEKFDKMMEQLLKVDFSSILLPLQRSFAS